MSIVSNRTVGLAALRNRLASLPARAVAASRPAFGVVAERVADDARAALGEVVAPSVPGGPPADPGDRLVATVSASSDAATPGSTVTVSAPFARFLEYGTCRMAARPFLRPAALGLTAEARTLLATALRRGLAP